MHKSVKKIQSKIHVVIDTIVKNYNYLNDATVEVLYDNYRALETNKKKSNENKH